MLVLRTPLIVFRLPSSVFPSLARLVRNMFQVRAETPCSTIEWRLDMRHIRHGQRCRHTATALLLAGGDIRHAARWHISCPSSLPNWPPWPPWLPPSPSYSPSCPSPISRRRRSRHVFPPTAGPGGCGRQREHPAVAEDAHQRVQHSHSRGCQRAVDLVHRRALAAQVRLQQQRHRRVHTSRVVSAPSRRGRQTRPMSTWLRRRHSSNATSSRH